MKAVEVNLYIDPHKTIIHGDVVEIEKTHCANREFKCLCCGRQWIETINSPMVIESAEIENNIEAYYKNIILCTQLEKS